MHRSRGEGRERAATPPTYRAVCVALTVAVCTAMLLLAAGLVPLALARAETPGGAWVPAAPVAAVQDSSPTR
jgi:hypothetical protein